MPDMPNGQNERDPSQAVAVDFRSMPVRAAQLYPAGPSARACRSACPSGCEVLFVLAHTAAIAVQTAAPTPPQPPSPTHPPTLQGGPYTRYSGGRTLTHELGHYFGLLHTFGDGSCATAGGHDGIADTPAQRELSNGCPVGKDSCPNQPGKDAVNNFMGG